MKSDRIIAIDIGNSATDLGLFSGANLLKYDFLPSLPEYSEKLCHIIESWKTGLEHVVIGSVVPSLGDLLETMLVERRGDSPMMVEDFKTELLPLRVDRPETVGVDRIVNCYAVKHLFTLPAIVISLGTATTFEAISSNGEYLGGAIVPGIKISLDSLTQRTALLPPVAIEKPKNIIGKNTLDHMKSGVYFGALSMMEGMVMRFRSKLGDHASVIGVGGLSKLFAEEGLFDHHEPYLNLKGLELIHRHRCRR
ncbi:MAG: type III pantothenate kinase [Candidatus Omnitrophica bacterium]|nr:type III pantothenate kinase [Candidatus Omnitrophota bacterium]